MIVYPKSGHPYRRACGQVAIRWPGRKQLACTKGCGLQPPPATQLVPRKRLRRVALAASLLLVLGLVGAVAQELTPTAEERARLRALLGPAPPADLGGATTLSGPKAGLRRGVGYVSPPGTTARWRHAQVSSSPISRPMDLTAHPWPEGAPYSDLGGVDFAAYLRRYGITREEFRILNPIGEFGERNHTGECLSSLCRAGLQNLGPASVYDCEATAEETGDAQFRNPAGAGIYAACAALNKPERSRECPPCETCKPCEPAKPCEPCAPCEPTICPPAPPPPTLPAELTELIRYLRGATMGVRREPIPVTAKLRRGIRDFEDWLRRNTYQPGIPSTGRLDVKVIDKAPDGLTVHAGHEVWP